jgi:DnaJ-class molecular chaperone
MSRLAELVTFIEDTYSDLDLYSYYQLLELDERADAEAIRSAFYQQAARLHPDRFATLRDDVVRQKLTAIYARIAEAYKVLSDPRKRPLYDAGIRKGQLRYLDMEREKRGPQNPEDAVERPDAKKFVRLALQAQRAGDLKGAHMNFKFALAYESDNAYLREQIGALEAELARRSTMAPGEVK